MSTELKVIYKPDTVGGYHDTEHIAEGIAQDSIKQQEGVIPTGVSSYTCRSKK